MHKTIAFLIILWLVCFYGAAVDVTADHGRIAAALYHARAPVSTLAPRMHALADRVPAR